MEDCAQRPRLAAVLAFYNVEPATEADLPAGRQVEIIKLKITTNAEKNSPDKSGQAVSRIIADSTPMPIVIPSRQHSSKPHVSSCC
jgi:hypothetical protein